MPSKHRAARRAAARFESERSRVQPDSSRARAASAVREIGWAAGHKPATIARRVARQLRLPR